MPREPLAPTLLRQLRAIDRHLPAPRVRRLHLPPVLPERPREAEFCAIELADGAFGLSYVLLDQSLAQLIARHRPAGAGDAPPLVGADALALAAAFGGSDGAANALALAAINALTQSAWRRLGYAPPAADNSVGDVALAPGDHLGMIGGFTPLVRQVLNVGAALSIVELDAQKVQRLQAEFPQILATLDRAALAPCNKIVATSTMLLNGTLDAMLAACPAATEFALIGPSAGLWADALFERGVTRLCGTQVVDGAACAEAMARGERWGGAARKFAIDRAAWPGWQALLAG